VNVIPAGAIYTSGGDYYLTLIANTNYTITFGANDSNLGVYPSNPTAPGTFPFSTGNSTDFVLFGVDGAIPVTAIICYVSASLAFSSVTPSTASAFAQNYDGVISGTGFTLSGINLMKVDNGAGSSFNFTTMTISNDTTINVELAGAQMTPPGVYTIYYSKDAGATWTTTGLTITSS
jgi:hypothetical protein